MKNNLELIKKFNNYFPVGAMVKWQSVNHPNYQHKEYTVEHSAMDHHGQAVGWLKEHRGFVSIEPGFVDYSEIEKLDWQNAKLHFDGVRQTYEALVDAPGVNTVIALVTVFTPLAARYDSGERSEELYNAMMAVE